MEKRNKLINKVELPAKVKQGDNNVIIEFSEEIPNDWF